MRILLLLALLMPASLWANDWDALRAQGAVAIMRHALAPGGGDPANHTIGDCSTQRNLSAQGRDQARRIGAALRARDIRFDNIYSSQWCRTYDTALEMDMGAVEYVPALNSFFGKFEQRAPQTRALRRALEAADGLNLWVTHQVNISALTGTATRSGEIIVFRLTPEGTEVLGRIEIAP